ncbi:MAG: hypothetical protein WAL09_22390, partial [Pseudolabrys sp.]
YWIRRDTICAGHTHHPLVDAIARLCLSEFTLALTDDEVRREIASAKCGQQHVLFAATARLC